MNKTEAEKRKAAAEAIRGLADSIRAKPSPTTKRWLAWEAFYLIMADSETILRALEGKSDE